MLSEQNTFPPLSAGKNGRTAVLACAFYNEAAYESTFGVNITIPNVDAKYVDILSKYRLQSQESEEGTNIVYEKDKTPKTHGRVYKE